MDKPSDPDVAIRVVVTPSQSSYFAGEPFSVTITLTNTRTPESESTSRVPLNTHKRGVHSISSAPLARPPTSPGTPRPSSAALQQRARGANILQRRGLVGKGPESKEIDQLPGLIEQRRNRLLARSLSVTIIPHELEGTREEPRSARNPSYTNRIFDSPVSPHIPSPLGRSHSLPLSSDHPHARKQSIIDGQLHLNNMSLSGPTSPYTPSASTSTFSLALDPITESAPSPYPSTSSFLSPTPENHATPSPTSMNPPTHSYPPRPTQARRPTHLAAPNSIGLGKPSSSSQLHPPRTAFSSSFAPSSSELILYSYAQLSGTLAITPLPGTTATLDQQKTLNTLRSALLKRAVVGGGSMDITSSLHNPPPAPPPAKRSHSRASSFSMGLYSLLSPSSSTPPASSAPWTPAHRRGASALSGKNGGVGLGIGGGAVEENVDPDALMPTFEVQPTMLAVDLSLLPGESRSYTYTINLPENVPPTFKGRALRFSYELIVGTCRAGSAPGSGANNSVSRVMKVPIRVYNNVVVGRVPRPYDLMWPVTKRQSPPSASEATIVEEMFGKTGKTSSQVVPSGTLGDLQDYARRLVASFPEPGASGVRIKLPAESIPPVIGDPVREREREMEREDEGGLTGCREAVEILTRNPKKVSYDVNKDGVKVAVLTFTKSAYRLGETILGVVELNERPSRARVLQLSAMLESQESLPSSISAPSNSRHLRRVHAEHHSSFVISTLRTTFSLDIPSDASPAFQVNVAESNPSSPKAAPPKPGGLEWKVRLCLLVAVADESSHTGTEGVRIKHLVRDGGRGEWGSSWQAPINIAPMERSSVRQNSGPGKPEARNASTTKSWAAFFAASFLGAAEGGYHDGDEIDGGFDEEQEEREYDGVKGDKDGGVGVGVNFGGGEEGWKEVRVETVECEVPMRVWPGNTAFKATDVVFDV